MMGGSWFLEKFGTGPEKAHLARIAESEVKRILKIKENPSNVNVSILKNCIPQYIVGKSFPKSGDPVSGLNFVSRTQRSRSAHSGLHQGT